MDMTDTTFVARLLAIPVALTLDPFAPPLVFGVALRMGWVDDPVLTRPEFAGFAEPTFLACAGTLYVVHALADKLPPFGHLFDAIGILLKPIAAAAVGLWMTHRLAHGSAMHWVALSVMLLGAIPAVIGVQSARSKIRLAASGSSAGALHPAASTFENIVSLPVAFLSILRPELALAVIAVVIVPCLWVGLRFARLAARSVRRIGGALTRPAREVAGRGRAGSAGRFP